MAPTPQHLRSGGGKSEDVKNVNLCPGSYGAKRRKGQNRPILRPPGFPSATQPPPTLLAGTIDELDIRKKIICKDLFIFLFMLEYLFFPLFF